MDINLLAKNSGNKKQIFLSKKKEKSCFTQLRKWNWQLSEEAKSHLQ